MVLQKSFSWFKSKGQEVSMVPILQSFRHFTLQRNGARGRNRPPPPPPISPPPKKKKLNKVFKIKP